MRLINLIAVVLLAATSAASAETRAWNFQVKFQPGLNSCTFAPRISPGNSVTLTRRTPGNIVVTIPGVTSLNGSAGGAGRFRATAGDKKAKYSVAGRAKARKIRLVLIAEYSEQGKTCTQTWKARGKRTR